MAKTLKLIFNNDEGKTRTISISNPKANPGQEETIVAMEAIVDSGAFVDIVSVKKAVLYSSDSELVYEA